MPQKYHPEDFKYTLKDEYAFASTLGKLEYELIAQFIIKKSLKEGEWVGINIEQSYDAKNMAKIGFLEIMCHPIVRDFDLGDLRIQRGKVNQEQISIYEMSQEGIKISPVYTLSKKALDNIMKRKNKNQ